MTHLISLVLACLIVESNLGFISPKSFWYQHGHENEYLILMDRHRLYEDAAYLYMDKRNMMYVVVIVHVKTRLDHVSPKKVVEEYPIASFEDALDFFPFLTEDTYGIFP